MTKERTARKRGHKNEAREHQLPPTQEGVELANQPNFNEESEESTRVPTEADKRDV